MAAAATTTALEKHDCAACGAQGEWHPGRQLLICPFCGTEAPSEVGEDGAAIEEFDLVAALRAIPDEERGWLVERRSVRCRSCKAVSVFEPNRAGQRCEFCGSPGLVDYEEIRSPLRLRSLIPFSVAQDEIRDRLRQ